MSTDILITDDRLSFSLSLADILRVQGLRVCVTSEDSSSAIKNSEKDNRIGPFAIWNRSSIFSVQSLALQFKNLHIDIDTAVITFDGPAYMELYPQTDPLSADTTCTELINAHMQLISMLITYFTEKKTGKLIFVHKELPIPCGNMALAAASASFTRIAEETAALDEGKHNIQTMLVRLEGEEPSVNAEWLATQIQQPTFNRTANRWIKPVQRSLFNK